MNIICYRCGFRNLKEYKYFMSGNVIKLYSKSKDEGFMNYVDIVGKEHPNLFMKTISSNDKRIIDMYSIELYIEINAHKEKVRIRNGNIFFCLEIQGLDKDIEVDYMMQTGFIPKEVQWDKYGLHWNHYSLYYEDLISKFDEFRLYTVKINEKSKEEVIADIGFEEAVHLFEECKE